ncbi:hypothetical protein [Zunongwangia pacifica]|uniref:Uncharacterized protein n=1 Tax=Zunongwangia pacifica TaxID=2911062 RepID=A0A9X1ZWC5_9FLAO|nr:hypothetical protein [Zunongwangia pacifica]MCL6218918.1 hypothetical protein [Zunongwangia pacifica]
MVPNTVIDRIEFILNKDETTQQNYTLQQFDYSIASAYDIHNESEKRMDVYASGCNNNEPDQLFLEWIANHPGDWSGIVKIFFKNEETPNITLHFKKSIAQSYNQSFTENNGYQQNGYFSANLMGVVINNVAVN